MNLSLSERVQKRSDRLGEHVDPSKDWTRTYETVINGRHVRERTELTIKGERGSFRFLYLVDNGKTQWLEVIGGGKGEHSFRSFRPERVKRVKLQSKREKAGGER